MNEDEAQISLMSWNIRALRNKVDLLTIVTTKRQVDIVFLQETHIAKKDEDVFHMLEEWHTSYTLYEPQSKGVAILIRKDIDYEIILENTDQFGSCIIAKCKIRGQLYTLVNLYICPLNRFLLYIYTQYFQKIAEGVLVIGGDFNTTLNPYMDRISTVRDHHAATRRCVDKFTESFSLVDVWRRINPTEKKYTYTQNSSESRLDYIFMQEKSMWRVKTCEIIDSPVFSDHKPVYLQLTSTPSSHGPFPDTDLYFLVAPILAWHLEKHFKDMTAQTVKAKNKIKSLLVIHPGRKENVKWSLLEEAIEALKDPLLKSTLFDKLTRSDQDQDCKQLQPDCLLTTALLKLYVTHFMRKVQTDELFPSGVTTGILIYGETVMMSLSFKAKEKLEIRQSLLEETRRRRQDLMSAILPSMQDEDEDEDEHEEEEEDEDEDQDQLYKQLRCDHPRTPGLLTLCVAHLMSKAQTRGRFFPTRPKVKNLTDNETVMISVSFE